MQQSISPMLKRVWRGSKRPATAYCVLTVDGKRRQVTLGQWGSKEALDSYKRLTSEASISDSNGARLLSLHSAPVFMQTLKSGRRTPPASLTLGSCATMQPLLNIL